ncbi:FRG domain-containing protein [Actinobacillus equuli subsp. haemolyticus]|nr:FRG domain-containing protein [Actinobacillus equuli subsp. haemolyticus]WGE88225.1 FRG domain-containing protein [Actinobacillus equuli subsp. haemolyticus]
MDTIPLITTINTWSEFKEYIESTNIYKTEENGAPFDVPIIYDDKEISQRFYRGHSNKRYRLQSTLERYINNESLTRKQFDEIQKEFLHVCKNTLKGKISEQFILFDTKFDNEIWAIGQHYGLRTPLLDWTKSFWVALYFAFEELQSESDYRVIYILSQFMSESTYPVIQSKIDIGGRLYAQKGVFTNLLASEIEERNKKPEAIFEIDPPITKIFISSNLRNEVMSFLYSINIHASTLFPDIYGAIKDCHLRLDEIVFFNSE